MARPSKHRIAAEKKAASQARRASALEAAYHIAPFATLADFAYVECERCNQQQLNAEVCIVCGHDVARTHPLHAELKAEAEALLRGEAERLAA